ncbi:hypothetical protein GQ457_01G009780 [Hibiscus cannabinus]
MEGVTPGSCEVGYGDLISWPGQASSSQMKSSNTEYSELAPKNCDDETEGVQSKEGWAYVKVNTDKILVGSKVFMLDHFQGRHTTSGLRLFEIEYDFFIVLQGQLGGCSEECWRHSMEVSL